MVRICPKEGQGLAEALLVYALKRKKPLASFICFSSEFKISSPVIARKGAIRSYEQTVKGILHKKKKKIVVGFLQFLQLSSCEMLDVVRTFLLGS